MKQRILFVMLGICVFFFVSAVFAPNASAIFSNATLQFSFATVAILGLGGIIYRIVHK